MLSGGFGDEAVGKGTRRRKMAEYLRAANDVRLSYQEAYSRRHAVEGEETNVPGAFPNLKVSRSGNEELILFPSYARRHVKRSEQPPKPQVTGVDDLQRAPGDAEYWQREWEIYEDANAIVDVDVRGWIYSPQSGPLNRKERLLMSVARRLSGIPAPEGSSEPSSLAPSAVRGHAARQEEELAARKAQEIRARGEREAAMAGRGGYSEQPEDATNPASPRPGHIVHPVSNVSLSSEHGSLATRASWPQPANMSPEELAHANKHLVTRLRPFMSTPSAGMAMTLFFYNATTSQSRSTRTDEAGHFNFRAALNFVPTHVRVLASETLSTTEPVIITEPKGVSVISDIDDTIKHTDISAGAREIFRNAFIRHLRDLSIDGVQDWYWDMAELGVGIHYVSNSPWQMYPVLDSYFHETALPPGSYHLKQYSGMLQGIFEPVAERKRGTIDRLLGDFPERRFILIGDSGEADLEVYAETALMYPGRILGIFIRDVTTDPRQGLANASIPAPLPSTENLPPGSQPPPLPPRHAAAPVEDDLPDLGDLIDFSSSDSEPEASQPARDAGDHSGLGLPASLRAGPPPPIKPLALRSRSNEFPIPVESAAPDAQGSQDATLAYRPPPPPPPPRPGRDNTTPSNGPPTPVETAARAAPPLPPRRPLPPHASATSPEMSPKPWGGLGSNAGIMHTSSEAATATTGHTCPISEAAGSLTGAAAKRIELWSRRWARASAALQGSGVVLRTWRVGSDVQGEAMGLIRAAQLS